MALDRIVQVVVFLGLVILVHELGHFLAARWCGVLVERFSIGFGPILLAFKRGETEYAISAIPLGGYVKMLGQSDTPTVEEASDNPRSYQNKTVLQRMLIISAGVIMNVIFGILCFAIVFTIGLPYQPATIGTVTPGMPAWKAGLQPGDRIVEVGGIKNPWYDALVYQVMFTNPSKHTLDLTVVRDGKPIDYHLRPEYASKSDDKPIIGVGQSSGLNLIDEENIPPTEVNSRARQATSPGFAPGDRVTAVDGQPVKTYQEFDRRMFDRRRDPVAITVERKAQEGQTPVREDVRVAPAFVRTIGLAMTMGEIKAVREGSPADKAVDAEGNPKPIEAKDQILAVDSVVNPDPLRVPDMLAEKAGQRVELVIRRQRTMPEEFKVYVVPDSTPTWIDFFHPPTPVSTLASIPSLGVAYDVMNTVQSVEPNSPAAKASIAIQPGDFVKSVDYAIDTTDAPPAKRVWWNPLTWMNKEYSTVNFRCSPNSWPGVFWGMQNTAFSRVKLQIERSEGKDGPKTFEVELTPVEDSTWPFHLRGLRFLPVMGMQRGSNPLDAVLIGFDYTKVTMQRIYLTLRGLVTRQIKPTLLSGPLQLATVAYQAADDWRFFLLFIGLININLAVINFLPIPVLDGGHMMFLLYEGITRRRPNERVVFAGHLVGFVFIVFLMLSVISLDIWKLFLQQPKL